MKFLVIGLGIYGANLARDLTAMGHEVVGADIKRTNVDAIKDYIATSYILDSSDPASIDVLPLKAVDVVIVAIGENFGASVRTVAILKKAGVKTIYARAIDDLHLSILQSFNIARILTPEQNAARYLTEEMTLGTEVSSMQVDDHTWVMRFAIPEFFTGMAYSRLDFERRFGLRLIAATRPRVYRDVLGIERTRPVMLDLDQDDLVVEPGDQVVVMGSENGLRALHRHIS